MALTVTIYRRPDCDFCDQARAWLEAHGVAFTERNLTQDAVASSELARMGVFDAPAIVVGGQVLLSFDPEALAAVLSQDVRGTRAEQQAARTDQGP